MTKKLFAPAAFVLALLLGVYGCHSPDDIATPPAPGEETQDKQDHSMHAEGDHAGSDQGAKKSDMEKMTEHLATFSPEDRESAMKQHFCPVSGAMLGTMGAPEKVDVNGQPVWICCDGCKDKLLADPDKYLAKLAK